MVQQQSAGWPPHHYSKLRNDTPYHKKHSREKEGGVGGSEIPTYAHYNVSFKP